MKIKQFLLVCFFALLSFENFATHIVGGEIYYDYISPGTYKITLKVYRDCSSPANAGFDSLAYVFIYNSAGALVDSLKLALNPPVQVPPTINNPCFVPPVGICVEETTYNTTVFLPPLAGGYDILYERCCRNNTILNIVSPGDVGSTYWTHIPDPGLAVVNSSPRYTNFPPIFLCESVPLFFDHSAIDPDGDSLYYEFCDPFDGASSCCPLFGAPVLTAGVSPGCPPASTCPLVPPPPPSPYIPWLAPYNATYPMSSLPLMAVNSTTGLLTGTPDLVGQWVVGVCASEYRNGVLLSVNKRDFQFNVVPCPGIPVASIPNQTDSCFGYTVNFTQASLNAFTYSWDFGDPATSLDTSSILAPIWTYADSGTYVVTLIINPGMLCADTNTTTFYIYPLLAPTFTSPLGECIYENSFNFTGAGAYMGNGTFYWNFGPNAIPSSGSSASITNVVYDSVGTYPVTFTVSENGCTETYAGTVNVYPKPIADYTLASPLACNLQPVHFIDACQSFGVPSTYYWDFGDSTSGSDQNPYHIYPGIGTYQTSLIITTMHNCKDTFALPTQVNVLPSPTAGFIITPTDTSIAYPLVTATNLSLDANDCIIYWGDGTSSTNCDTTHLYAAVGLYTVLQVVTNSLGCKDTAKIYVLIHPEYAFWIPNAFTPNGNGINDVFKPKVMGVHDYSFMIFDRWGEKLFETKSIDDGWDGYYKGKICPNDVFVYKINFRDNVDEMDHEYIGGVTLVR